MEFPSGQPQRQGDKYSGFDDTLSQITSKAPLQNTHPLVVYQHVRLPSSMPARGVGIF